MKKITVPEAAKMLNMPAEFLRAGLRTGRIPIGFAIQHNPDKSDRWTYYISPVKLKEFIEENTLESSAS